MRIINIDIRNYRQYQSLSLNFPQAASNDLHIIVAQNGVGKTNLLNAITWCLYGREPHLGNESDKRGMPKMNITAFKEARERGVKIETAEVSISAQDDDCTFIYKRTLPFRVESEFELQAEEKFTVTTTQGIGDYKILEGDEAKHYVEKYMPEKIREYFYFDGEQLNDYFISERRGSIRDAIFSISQVDVVSRIGKRIGDLIDNKRKEAGSKEPNIRKITDALGTCGIQIEVIQKNIRDIEEQIGLSEQIIQDNTEFLRGQENLPDLEIKLQKLKEQRQGLDRAENEHLAKIFSFVHEMKSALIFYSVSQKALAVISQKEDEGAFPPNIDKALLQQMLEEHICSICQQELGTKEKEVIHSLLSRYQVSSETANILSGVKSELERVIITAHNYPNEKALIIEEHERLKNQIGEVEQQLQDIENQLTRFGDKEQVRHKYFERKEHMTLRDSNMQKLGVFNEQFETENEKKKLLTLDLKNALEKATECKRLRQLIEFAEKGRAIMNSVETEMMDEVRVKMQQRTTEYFKQLVWKQNTYDRIELNKQFQLDLFHRDGYSCVGTCSAAERCLLALSFTLALHEVSGFNSLLFIDTPVARVSDNNRINFANVLCNVSMSKQIIMTFSPDEYSHEISKVFEPIASTKSNLHMVDEKVTVLK